MDEYLYRFGFEFPAQRLANDKYGWDDEDSYSFFVEAENPERALEWAREVSEAFCHYMYRESGWTRALPSWKADAFAHWIEDDPEEVAAAREWGAPRVAVGVMPDFAEWPDVI